MSYRLCLQETPLQVLVDGADLVEDVRWINQKERGLTSLSANFIQTMVTVWSEH